MGMGVWKKDGPGRGKKRVKTFILDYLMVVSDGKYLCMKLGQNM